MNPTNPWARNCLSRGAPLGDIVEAASVVESSPWCYLNWFIEEPPLRLFYGVAGILGAGGSLFIALQIKGEGKEGRKVREREKGRRGKMCTFYVIHVFFFFFLRNMSNFFAT